MVLVNETNQQVSYWITCTGGGPDCGEIAVNGLVDLPKYDNQTNVVVGFKPVLPAKSITIQVSNTGTGQQIEMALVAE
jgi:hypothetical protein